MMSVRRLALLPDQNDALRARQKQLEGCLPYDHQVATAWRGFSGSLRKAVVLKLECQSRWRCIYCETPGSAHTVEHYLPKKQFPGHTFDWLNLGLACGACQSYKLEPLQFRGVWPLIVDPLNEKADPFFYISTGNGRITPALHLPEGQLEWERAKETILRLRLNERNLPQVRLRVALGLRRALQRFRDNPGRRLEDDLLKILYPSQPWPAVVHQIMTDSEGPEAELVTFCLERSDRIRRYLRARNWIA